MRLHLVSVAALLLLAFLPLIVGWRQRTLFRFLCDDGSSQVPARTVYRLREFFEHVMRGNASIPHDEGLLDAPATKDYFNGWIEYRVKTRHSPDDWKLSPFESLGPSPNFHTDSAAFARLVDHHARFFADNFFLCGQEYVLLPGHNNTSFIPLYNSTMDGFGPFTMRDVHANMKIGPAAFSAFAERILFVARLMGMKPDAADDLRSNLATYGRMSVRSNRVSLSLDDGWSTADVICGAPDCPCAEGFFEAPEGGDCEFLQPVPAHKLDEGLWQKMRLAVLLIGALALLFAMEIVAGRRLRTKCRAVWLQHTVAREPSFEPISMIELEPRNAQHAEEANDSEDDEASLEPGLDSSGDGVSIGAALDSFDSLDLLRESFRAMMAAVQESTAVAAKATENQGNCTAFSARCERMLPTLQRLEDYWTRQLTREQQQLSNSKEAIEERKEVAQEILPSMRQLQPKLNVAVRRFDDAVKLIRHCADEPSLPEAVSVHDRMRDADDRVLSALQALLPAKAVTASDPTLQLCVKLFVALRQERPYVDIDEYLCNQIEAASAETRMDVGRLEGDVQDTTESVRLEVTQLRVKLPAFELKQSETDDRMDRFSRAIAQPGL